MGSPASAVFLQAEGSTNDHDLGLFQIGPQAGPSGAGRSTVGLYHLAWEVDTLDELARIRAALQAAGSLVGASDHGTTKALYAQDPDGIEFEVSWLVPADRLERRRATTTRRSRRSTSTPRSPATAPTPPAAWASRTP